jgi:hypothetical protein
METKMSNEMMTAPTKAERPCRRYLADGRCKDGRDHCFNCACHLDGECCPKGCGEGDDARDDAANNEDEGTP